MKFNKYFPFIFLFAILFIFFISYSKTIEPFSFSSIPSDDSSSASSTTKIDPKYNYLAPLPDDNVWPKDIQAAFIKKTNEIMLSNDPSATIISSIQVVNGKSIMNFASEEEAKYYIENGEWPWDIYLKNEVNKINPGILKMWPKIAPNRVFYNMISTNTLPQSTILSALNPSNGVGIPIPSKNQILKCLSNGGATVSNNPDGTNVTFPSNGNYPYLVGMNSGNSRGTYTLDYTIFESIPGLSFDGSACNICQTPNFTYTSPSNDCKFSMVTPEAYNIYSGSNVKSTPSTVADSSSGTSDSSDSSTSPPPKTTSSFF